MAVRELSLVDLDVGVELVRLTVLAAVVAGFEHMGMAVKEDSRVWSMELGFDADDGEAEIALGACGAEPHCTMTFGND